MKMMKFISIFLTLACVLAFHEYAEAQYQVSHHVIGNGGSAVANTNNRLVGTVGQPLIGVMSNASNTHKAGFWYQSENFVTSVEQTSSNLPTEYRLEQNYPNPFNPTTTIGFALPERVEVILKVFDVHGREVAELVRATQAAGYYSVNFNAEDLASGVYFYRLEANGKNLWTQTRKLVLMK